MSKEKEIMDYLHSNIFNPILNSPTSEIDLKKGVKYTIMKMKKLDAEGMIKYYWSAIVGTEKSIRFAEKIDNAGFRRFEDVIEEFRIKFNDKWLRS